MTLPPDQGGGTQHAQPVPPAGETPPTNGAPATGHWEPDEHARAYAKKYADGRVSGVVKELEKSKAELDAYKAAEKEREDKLRADLREQGKLQELLDAQNVTLGERDAELAELRGYKTELDAIKAERKQRYEDKLAALTKRAKEMDKAEHFEGFVKHLPEDVGKASALLDSYAEQALKEPPPRPGGYSGPVRPGAALSPEERRAQYAEASMAFMMGNPRDKGGDQ